MGTPRLGCYGVVRTGGFHAWLIRTFTRSAYDHAFIVCDGGQIIEAEPGGARWGRLAEYAGHGVLISADPMDAEQRVIVVDEAIRLLGVRYGWLDIVRLGLATVGIRWKWLTRRADSERAMVCSQIVAACGQAAGLDWLCGQESPAAVTPGMLAKRPGMERWAS